MFFLFHRRRRAPHSVQKRTYELRARQFRRDHRLFLSRNVKWVDEMLRTRPAYTRESCQKWFENLFARLPNGKSMSTIRSLKLIDFSHRAFHPAEWTVRSTCVSFHLKCRLQSTLFLFPLSTFQRWIDVAKINRFSPIDWWLSMRVCHISWWQCRVPNTLHMSCKHTSPSHERLNRVYRWHVENGIYILEESKKVLSK